VDGTANSLMIDKLVTERLPESSPRRSLWRVESSAARTEQEAMRHSTMNEPEVWRIVNSGIKGAYGDPVGYEVSGGHAVLTLLSPDDYMQRGGGFTNHTLWVTPYRPDELFAAGDYPSLSTEGQGLPTWTTANRPPPGRVLQPESRDRLTKDAVRSSIFRWTQELSVLVSDNDDVTTD
jgi:primary-amine oxidase